MGNSGYSFSARATRSATLGYAAASAGDARVFRQNALKRVNEGMDPSQIIRREARDSEAHPLSVPIVLKLDVTGSMGRIPAELIKGDLPHLMGHLVEGERECPDAALLFMAVGDLFSDSGPLQVGQFESGDAELDHWLTTTWIEGNGGNNDGESYSLGWLFALNMIETDAWDKRKERGLFISVGDEPLHREMPVSKLRQLFGNNFDKVVEGLEFSGNTIQSADVLAKLKKRWNVHHIQVGEGADGFHTNSWKMLGEGYHTICRDCSVADKTREIIKAHMASGRRSAAAVTEPAPVEAAAGEPAQPGTPTPPKASIPEPL
jgi:hypothetical protein